MFSLLSFTGISQWCSACFLRTKILYPFSDFSYFYKSKRKNSCSIYPPSSDFFNNKLTVYLSMEAMIGYLWDFSAFYPTSQIFRLLTKMVSDIFLHAFWYISVIRHFNNLGKGSSHSLMPNCRRVDGLNSIFFNRISCPFHFIMTY